MFYSRPAGHKYVYRGDAPDYDFKIGNFTIPQDWTALSLAHIVPKGAVAVALYLRANGNTPNARMYIKKNGQLSTYNVLVVAQGYGSVQTINNGIVAIDNNRCIACKIDDATWNSIQLTVCGWFIHP